MKTLSSKYIYILRDHGQDICDQCELHGDDDLIEWEYFMNGEWVDDPPDLPGLYPVVLTGHKPSKKMARIAQNSKSKCVWVDPKIRAKVRQRWSTPYPDPPANK